MNFLKRNIPSGWALKKMPDVVKWSSGGTPKATQKSYYENGTIPWLIIGDLNDGVVTSSASKITELGLQNSNAKMIPVGTLLVAMYGSIGKLGITGIECCTNQAIAYAKELKGVSTKYMYYYMAMMKSELISHGKGGTQKNISQTVLNSLEVLVPPEKEQERIVNKIEELFSELDSAVETLKKTKEQLAVYRQSVLKEAFVNCEENEKMGNVATMIDPHPSHRTPPEYENGVPYIGVGDIDYKNNFIKIDEARKVNPSIYEDHLQRYTIRSGDFIMGKIGTIGKPYRLPLPQNYALSANVILIKPNSDIINPEYLFWQFSSPIVIEQLMEGKNETSQPAFGIQKARLLNIKMCNYDIQNKIVADIREKMSVCENIEKTVNDALMQADAMRQSILKKAFDGSL